VELFTNKEIELAVSFQEVVHSALTEEAEVAEASDSEGRTEWTPIRMRL
jgi:hypothetical protein